MTEQAAAADKLAAGWRKLNAAQAVKKAAADKLAAEKAKAEKAKADQKLERSVARRCRRWLRRWCCCCQGEEDKAKVAAVAPGDGDGGEDTPTKVVVVSIDWEMIQTHPAHTIQKTSLKVGRTDKTIKSTSSSKSFSFAFAAGFSGFGAEVSATTSKSLTSTLSSTNETTMNTETTIERTFESRPQTTYVWCLVMKGVLLADSPRYSALPLLTCPATPTISQAKEVTTTNSQSTWS